MFFPKSIDSSSSHLSNPDELFAGVLDEDIVDYLFIDGGTPPKLWVQGSWVCSQLGFTNPGQAITMHTDKDERAQFVIAGRCTWYLTEPGVWGIILQSKTEKALAFKRKLKRELLSSPNAYVTYGQPVVSQ